LEGTSVTERLQLGGDEGIIVALQSDNPAKKIIQENGLA
jgi:hypothetical protein